jgi:hypothetical protein
LVTAVVSSNCLVPSGSTVGASSCAPRPSVFCGYAAIEAFIAASMSCHDIDEWLSLLVVSPAAATSLAATPAVTCSFAVMPAEACPGTWQITV